MQLNLMPQIQAVNPYHQALQTGLEDYMNITKAKYAPLTAQADAASKLTYANLMGPQFLAKLMGNQDFVANLSPQQTKNAVNTTYNAATGQGIGNTVSGGSQEPSFLDKLKTFLHLGQQNQTNPVKNLTPLQQMMAANPDKAQAIHDEYIRTGQVVMPQPSPTGSQPQQLNNKTYFENAGEAAGIKKEGEKSGELRAQDIADLGNTISNGQTKLTTLNSLNGILASPEIRQMRSTPALGAHELSWYAQYGTPAQQQLVGRLRTITGDVVRSSARDFPGAFRKGEQELLNGMKVKMGDTIDSAIGKAEELTYLTQMVRDRSMLTQKLMKQNHMSKADATEIADKKLNGDAVRARIHNRLNPKPTDADIEYMSQIYKVSKDEIMNRLKKRGLL